MQFLIFHPQFLSLSLPPTGHRTIILCALSGQDADRDSDPRHVALGQQFLVAVPDLDVTFSVATAHEHLILGDGVDRL